MKRKKKKTRFWPSDIFSGETCIIWTKFAIYINAQIFMINKFRFSLFGSEHWGVFKTSLPKRYSLDLSLPDHKVNGFIKLISVHKSVDLQQNKKKNHSWGKQINKK
jgi:hypothetical protein